MKFKKFHQLLFKHNTEIGNFHPYRGKMKDVILAENLQERETAKLISESILEGKNYKTANMCCKQDLEQIGVKVSSSEKFYLFDKPQKFTVPVLVPIE